MDLGNVSLMSSMMDQFRTNILAGATHILPDALALLATLGTIDIALTFIFNRDQDPLTLLTEKFLQIVEASFWKASDPEFVVLGVAD